MKAFLLLCLCILLSSKARSAVVANSTGEQVSAMLSTATISWIVQIESGYQSFLPEITNTSNGTFTAQNDTWTSPASLVVSYDLSGNLLAAVGSGVAISQPTLPFDTIIVRLGDRSLLLPTELRNGSFNGISFRDMYADDGNSNVDAYDYLIFTDVTGEFSLVADFFKSETAAGTESQFKAWGISVPEPSSSLLILVGFASLACKRRR
jgi:hypothetical protein